MRKLLFLLLLISQTCISCQCSQSQFPEYEGEHYDRSEEDKFVKKHRHTELAVARNRDIAQEEDCKDYSKDTCTFHGVGLPISTSDKQILHKKSYTASYNPDYRQPNWVIWQLTREHSDGTIPRSNDYREDPDVPYPRATNEDYRGSDWSRGHMCPAGDNKWDSIAVSESFLLSNMCPQNASLNSGLWNRIEMDCRSWARRYGSVYIVCGPLFYNKEHETIGANEVAVPEAFFKVVLCLEGEPKAIGFVVKNNAGTKKKDQYINTVDEVERLTGYDFFPALPDSIESMVEAKADINEWK